ncbi:hypothetical protein [Microlunatus ginsengisoli]|uniref:Regulatory protein n=1 Tax=Microlunatus ginsengisoli TaxID=363863 RepID=A0ABP7AFK3_9ACTN
MRLKINIEGIRFMVTKAHEPKLDHNTKQQKVDKSTGALQWKSQIMALDESGGEILTITTDFEPKVNVGEFVRVDGLVAMPWSTETGSGVAFRAGHIGPLNGSKPAEPGKAA